jgi:Flp pilus assembly protein TadD
MTSGSRVLSSSKSGSGVLGSVSRSTVAAAGLVAVLACAVYANTLWNGFVYDDLQQVLENRWITDFKYLPEVFAQDVWGFEHGEIGWHYYRPLMHVSYMLTYALFGLEAWGFHLVNVLLHAAISVLVFVIIGRVLKQPNGAEAPTWPWPAFAGASLFATHPVHTEVVAWVAGIPELSYTALALLSVLAYVKSRERGDSRTLYAASLGLFALALLAKETALVFPALLAAFDRISERDLRRLPWIRYAGFAVVAVLYVGLRLTVLGGVAPYRRHAELSAFEYAINSPPLFAAYLGKLLWPVGLNAFYVFHPIHSLLDPRGLGGVAVAAGALAGIVGCWRVHPRAFFGASVILLPLLPALYIPGLGENTFADRYLYAPSVGLAVLVAIGLRALVERGWKPRGLAVSAAIVVAAFSGGTVLRNVVWRDELRLWTDTVKKSPDGATPRNNLGLAYSALGQNERAIEQFEAAIRLKPAFAGAHNNLGIALGKEGRTDEAIVQFRIALSLKDVAGTRVNLGDALRRKGRLEEAFVEYQAAVTADPANADAQSSLGIEYGQRGDLDRAIEHLAKACKLSPRDPDTRRNLANAYRLKGLLREAEQQERVAQEIDASTKR